MTKILYDHHAFDQRIGGISRYFVEIISALGSDVDPCVSVTYSSNEYLEKIGVHAKVPYGQGAQGWRRLFRKYYFAQNQRNTLSLLRAQAFDLFHPTYYHDYFLPALGNKPFVLTIHDMIHEIYPELMGNDRAVYTQKANLAKHASHIIAVSQQTKQDIVDVYGIAKEKISVIYHGSSMVTAGDSSLPLPKRYVLYVGGRAGYKNFLFFAQAMTALLRKMPDVQVLCVGHPFAESEASFLNEFGIADRFQSMLVPDADLAFVYKNAACLVFPSYYEGFGIPILEAFAAECPVLLSHSSCFPEIAQDAALFFDGKNPAQLRQQVERVLTDVELANSLRKKGLKRFADFSWKRAAEETLAIYRGVCSGKLQNANNQAGF